jgi:hypothetical protein
MVPHDQQVEVTSPGMINDELDLGAGFAISGFTANALCATPAKEKRYRT